MNEFYMHSLRDQRWENYQFLMSLSRYVWQKDRPVEHAQPELQEMYHSKFIPNIGDTVLHFVNQLKRKEGYLEEIGVIVNAIHSEEFSGVGTTRDYVFNMASNYIREDNYNYENHVPNVHAPPYPFMDSNSRTNFKMRHYLVPKFNHSVSDEIIRENFDNDVKRSLFSPAMIQTEKFIDFCGLNLRKNDPKAYLIYFANVFTLVLDVAALKINGFVYHILGEAEHVMNVYKETFPGYECLDNYSRFKKSVQYSELEPKH